MTDIQMPKMGDIEMLQTIKEDNPNIPVVIISAFGKEEYADKLKDLDIDIYLSKPISHENAKLAFYNIAKKI
ncbi:MAG TPA: response regulator [Sulfurospirillum arcachonense]|nr:response regulator [Sulfurospirillum arcachonense]HIP45209.1 response regulator [Sulfurospirillum arcachonense]